MEDKSMERHEHTPRPEPVAETHESMAYLGVRLSKAQHGEGQFVPQRERYVDYIEDKFALGLEKDIAVSFLQGDPVLIEGGTSIGKTTTVRKMAADLGWEVHYANLNGATDVEDLMGRYIPNPNRTSSEDPEYIFADGKVTSGLRQEEGKIKVIILDEYNAAAPNILIRLHEVLDALNRGEAVVLSEDASEVLPVDRAVTKVVALMNPPGKGYFGREPLDPAQLRRWVYIKAPTDLPDETFSYSTDALFTLASQTEPISDNAYLVSRESALLPEQLQEIPGIELILGKYKEFHKAAKKLVKERKIAADQPQPFTYDDRMEPRRVRDFILSFYNGDINETFQAALRYYYANKVDSDVDKAKLEELIQYVEYVPPQNVSQRRPLETPDSKTEFRTPAVIEGRPDHMVSISEARDIFKDDFLGPQVLEKVFDIHLTGAEVPPMPFSKSELERAKELDQFLILRVDKAADGTPLTMQKMHTLLQSKFDKDKKGKILFSTDWYKDEDFFTKDVPRARWALVSKDVIPGSTGKNHLEQTRVLHDYLVNSVFKGRPMPPEYLKAINEFVTQESTIQSLLSSDWQEAARRLSKLKLNELTRQTPTEALYDLIAYFQNNDQRLLEDKYTWTSELASGGRLVHVGDFDAHGARVHYWDPGHSRSGFGVVLSR